MAIESLEPRQLFSAHFDAAHALIGIYGSNNNDDIRVTAERGNVVVRENGVTTLTVPLASTHGILAYGYGGTAAQFDHEAA